MVDRVDKADKVVETLDWKKPKKVHSVVLGQCSVVEFEHLIYDHSCLEQLILYLHRENPINSRNVLYFPSKNIIAHS